MKNAEIKYKTNLNGIKEPYNNRVERKIFVRHVVCSSRSKQVGLTANATPAPAGFALSSANPASNISAHSSVIRTEIKTMSRNLNQYMTTASIGTLIERI
jgi:hypothetical protein